MQKDWETRLRDLELGVGEELRSLPQVTPRPDLEEEIWAKLQAGAVTPSGQRAKVHQLFRFPRLGLVAAAMLLVLGGGWFWGIFQQQSQLASLGPLLLPTAQASVGQLGDLTFRLGLQNQLSNLDWQLTAELPNLPGELPIQRLVRPTLAAADALQLAERLVIKDAKSSGEVSVGNSVFVEGSNARLWLDLVQGSWQYEALTAFTGVAPTAESAQAAAVSWLKQAGVIHDEQCITSLEADGQNFWVNVQSASGPAGLPVVSVAPGFRLLIVRGNQVAYSSGAWYAPDAVIALSISTYRQAFQALQHGEGEFSARGFSPYQAGVAVVNKVSLGYQLALSMDYTPYLVPVAVFSGEVQFDQGKSAPFTAYVSLLESSSKHNAGNFRLATELPTRLDQAAVLKERPLIISQGELPELLRFFGMTEAQPDEYGTLRLGAAEISATSWDGGWLWRGEWKPSQLVSGPIGRQQAEAIAKELVLQLPVLPGTLGAAVFAGSSAGDDFYWISFPLIYDGIPVETLGSPSDSRISVRVNQVDGRVTSVNCAKPMQLQSEMVNLISPEQAWKKLQDNEAIVQLDSMFEQLPAARFQVEESLVSSVQLVYVPRDPAFARNEFYDLKYIFRGTAQIGEREIGFTAIVEADE